MPDNIEQLIKALEELPEEEREKRAAAYLEDLERHKKQGEETPPEGGKKLYKPFQILVDANLDLPPDYSETYEERLYGIDKGEEDDE